VSALQPEEQIESSDAASGPPALPPIQTRQVVREGVPRLLLNSLGPVGAFLVGEHIAGVVGGILGASTVSLVLFAWERRKGRPGLLATMTLGLLFLQVTIGLLASSATLYFLPTVGLDLIEGIACYISCFTRLPLAVVLAGELLALPRSALGLPPVRRLFIRLTLVWGTYFTVRGLVCLVVILVFPTEVYILVRALLDTPIVIPLVAWSIGYGVTKLKGIQT
jgi:hypothetical protein